MWLVDQVKRSYWREKSCLRLIAFAAFLVLLRAFFLVLAEYPKYFPADFESAFLSGRRYTFVSWYRLIFYVHILSGPIAIVLASLLLLTGSRTKLPGWHRRMGKTQAIVVLGILLPSGLYMSAHAYAGLVAGAGFATLSLATAMTLVMAIRKMRSGNLVAHRVWALRCLVLLISPLILRLLTGLAIVTEYESDWTYRINAWLSWIVPWIGLEFWIRRQRHMFVWKNLVVPATSSKEFA